MEWLDFSRLAAAAGAWDVPVFVGMVPLDSTARNHLGIVRFETGLFVLVDGAQHDTAVFDSIFGAVEVPFIGTGRVNRFFNTEAQNALALVESFLTLHNPAPFVYAGHSLGAAVVQLLGRQAAAAYPGRFGGVFTFGSPRVGFASWADGLNHPMLRVENYADPVTAIPPRLGTGLRWRSPRVELDLIFPYEHAGAAVTVDDEGGITRGSWTDGITGRVDEVWTVFLGAADPRGRWIHHDKHSLGEYARRLQAALSPHFASARRHMRDLGTLIELNAHFDRLERRSP